MSEKKRLLKLVRGIPPAPPSPPLPRENLKDGELHLVYDPYSEWVANPEPDSYIDHISGTVEIVHEEDWEKALEGPIKGTVVGRFEASYVNFDLAESEKVPLYDVMDAASADMESIYAALFNPDTHDFREELGELIGDIFLGNILVIDNVEILPEYRGVGLGLATLWQLFRRRSTGCGVVVTYAYPPQFNESFIRDMRLNEWGRMMYYESICDDENIAVNKLISYCGKLGFKKISENNVMAISTSLVHPIPKEIYRWVPSQLIRKTKRPK